MTPTDLWAAAAAAIAGVLFGLRGELLKPDLRRFVTAPSWVFVALLLLGAVLLTRSVSLGFGGAHANSWEALVYSALAAYAAVMLANLVRQRISAGVRS